MKTNPVKEKLRAGEVVVGGWITIPNPAVAEVMAQAGFEFLVIDTEHGAINIESVQLLQQAIAAFDAVPIVRVPGTQRMFTNNILDTGPSGLIVPMVNGREEAEAAVRAALYPPEGTRGIGLGRAHGYDLDQRNEYLKIANDLMLVGVQIEHRDAVERVEEIATTPGIDLLFVGPADLSGSMGLRGQPGHPEVKKAIEHVVQVAKRVGVPLGIPTGGPEDVAALVKQGFQFLHLGVDTVFLGGACREGLRKSRVAAARSLGQEVA
jgi:2-keto-3-deoxy-L-rhamnonate aldolase RhmA